MKLKLLTLFIFPISAFGKIDLNLTVHCSYQKGQYLSKSEVENSINSKPLRWVFNGLRSEKTSYMSGGDSGSVLSVALSEGVSIYFPFNTGAHSFTILNSGESFWNKQTFLINTYYSQQFIGQCTN